ncbi:MAG: hypothetical protein ACKVT0_21535 [Planctomycetaceae bacterium]
MFQSRNKNSGREKREGTQKIEPTCFISYSFFACFCLSLKPRNRYFGIGSRWSSLHLKALNAQLTTLSRVVLHPAYRGVGIAGPFVRRCCESLPFPWIETLTEMGHINPFFEKAGFIRVGVCDGPAQSRAGHSAIYGVKRKQHGTQKLLSEETHKKSRYTAPVYYLFDNRRCANSESNRTISRQDGSNEDRIPLFDERFA